MVFLLIMRSEIFLYKCNPIVSSWLFVGIHMYVDDYTRAQLRYASLDTVTACSRLLLR